MISPVYRRKSFQYVLEEVAQLCSWLDIDALPTWLDNGFDEQLGLFRERLDVDGMPCHDLPRRLLVQCRQVSVYAYATLRGRIDATARLVTVYDRMRELYLAPSKRGHWRFSIAPTGQPHDDRLDAYTLAFVVFALAWLYRVEPRKEYLEDADDVFAILDELLSAKGGGITQGHPAPDEFLSQNPNMHLFEACIALYESTRRPQYLRRAKELKLLFESQILDRRHRAVPERHNQEWGVWSSSQNWYEPGHHFEWAWLLRQYERLGGEDCTSVIDELLSRAVQEGLDKNSVVIERVGLEGNFVLESSRNWGTCEFIKLCAAEFQECNWKGDLENAESWAQKAADAMRALRSVFLSRPGRGLWYDRVDREYGSLTDHVPASSLYHIAFAVAEAERIFTRVVPSKVINKEAPRKALFLDRDGVVNVDVSYAHRPSQIRFVPGALDLIRTANRLGIFVVVVTNQSGVARGYFAESDVMSLHQWMSERLLENGARISSFYHCPFLGDAATSLYARHAHFDRKPAPGMIKRAALEWNIDLSKSILVGDQESDQMAAEGAGMKGFMITMGQEDLISCLTSLQYDAAASPEALL